MPARQAASYAGTILPQQDFAGQIRAGRQELLAAKESKQAEYDKLLEPDIQAKWDFDASNTINPMVEKIQNKAVGWQREQGGKLSQEQKYQIQSEFNKAIKIKDLSNAQLIGYANMEKSLHTRPKDYDVEVSQKNLDIMRDPAKYGGEDVKKQLAEFGGDVIKWRSIYGDGYGLVEKQEAVKYQTMTEIMGEWKSKKLIAPETGGDYTPEELATGQIKTGGRMGNTKVNREADIRKYYWDKKASINHNFKNLPQDIQDKYKNFDNPAQEWASSFEGTFKKSKTKAGLTVRKQPRIIKRDKSGNIITTQHTNPISVSFEGMQGYENFTSLAWIDLTKVFSNTDTSKAPNDLLSKNVINTETGKKVDSIGKRVHIMGGGVGFEHVATRPIKIKSKKTGKTWSYEVGQPIGDRHMEEIKKLESLKKFPSGGYTYGEWFYFTYKEPYDKENTKTGEIDVLYRDVYAKAPYKDYENIITTRAGGEITEALPEIKEQLVKKSGGGTEFDNIGK